VSHAVDHFFGNNFMNIRTRRHKITFDQPFFLEAVGRSRPAGAYGAVTDEELIVCAGDASVFGNRNCDSRST
jgi:hypothetical protein